MKPILNTKRLTLRPFSVSDQDSMVDLIMSDKDVMTWLPGSDKAATLEGQREVALEYTTDFTEPWDQFGFGVFVSEIMNWEPWGNS